MRSRCVLFLFPAKSLIAYFKVFRVFPPKLATFQKKSDATIATSEVFAYGVYSILHMGGLPLLCNYFGNIFPTLPE